MNTRVLDRVDRAILLANEMLQDKLTLEELGMRYGVSRQRMHQLLKSIGIVGYEYRFLRAKEQKFATCKVCDQTYPRTDRWRGGYRTHCTKAGHPARISKETWAKTQLIVADYLAGMKNKDIAVKYGMRHVEYVYRYLNYCNLVASKRPRKKGKRIK